MTRNPGRREGKGHRLLHLALVAAYGLSLCSVPSIAQAQQNPEQIATDACMDAVSNQLRADYGDVDRVQSTGTKAFQASNRETGIRGTGQFNDSAGDWTRFSFQCVFNQQTGEAYGVDIRAGRTQQPSNDGGNRSYQGSSEGDNMSAGQALGAAVGVAIAGAILDHQRRHGHGRPSGGNQGRDDGSWSPAAGVTCNSYRSQCYERGRFSPRWTNRIYLQ